MVDSLLSCHYSSIIEDVCPRWCPASQQLCLLDYMCVRTWTSVGPDYCDQIPCSMDLWHEVK